MLNNIIFADVDCDELISYYSNNGYCIAEKKLIELENSDFKDSIVVSNINDDNIDQIERLKVNIQKIVFTHKTLLPDKQKLMSLGFSKIIELDYLIKYKKLILNTHSLKDFKSEKFIIAGKKDFSSAILEDVFLTYNMNYEIIEKNEKLYDVIENKKDLIILYNLDCDEFELTEFVKKMTAKRFSKNIPIIPFKNRSVGVSAIDFNCGLHKIAKVILSSAELLSFVISYLIKRDLAHSQDHLFESNVIIDKMYTNSFTNIYHEMHDNLLEFEKAPDVADIDGFIRKIDDLKTCFFRMHVYKWLLV